MTAAVRDVLERHVDAAVGAGHVGIVAGALIDGDLSWHPGGARSSGGPAPDAHTIFRIGSVSKVVTAALLALAVRAGEVDLDDPVATHLPDWFRLPTYDGKPILVRHLGTHSSGMPGNVDDPGRGASVRTLAASLDGVALLSRPGSGWEYSNTGFAVLGAMLGFAAGADFQDLMADRLCGPLGVRDLALELDAEQRTRIAPGHDADGNPTFTPTYPAGAPSGGFYGTAADLLAFLGAHQSGPLRSTLELCTRSHMVTGDVGLGLGWHIDDFHSTRRVWKNGGLPGYRSHVAMADGIGVVVLSNTARSVDDLAGELLRDLL